MLDTETKRRIDTARDILVGKVPDPKSQVEQITIALIYKFMDDMDKESVSFGGEATFFTGEYEQYSWTRIFDPRVGGHEMLNLYGEAIVKLNQNPNIPQLFRDIFKNAYLPYRDPETLKLFLKTINEFRYDHSEMLGDAYEYLLSVLGSQGDAGQFRTPRHIIDFIVKILDPKKGETICDPSCGTAGLLISSYKHIVDQNTDKTKGDLLTPDERKKLIQNFTGYDISPDMVRMSLVNMYLHGFTVPKIYEYDTLTSEDRWNEYFDIVLANPPFMTPKGGIKPHKKFTIAANRSEVLFVDYIAEHIHPNTGRAGIIVPEGIIFQSATAYKSLRKMLVDNEMLYAVVSLPAGIFLPYSGVKTSILLLDKTLAKKTYNILMVKIESDGFDLGAQRRANDKNDLTGCLELLQQYKKAVLENTLFESDNKNVFLVDKKTIEEKGDYNLSIDRYRVNENVQRSNFEMVRLGDEELFRVESGGTPDTKNEAFWNGRISWATLVDLPQEDFISEIKNTAKKITDTGLKNSSAKIIPVNSILVSSRATIGRVGINRIELATNQGFKIIVIKNLERVVPEFVALMMKRLKSEMENLAAGGTFKEISKTNFCSLEIPLPPLSIQQEIVSKIEGYKRIIDGAMQVVSSYKPQIEIDPSWEMVKLGEVCESIADGDHMPPPKSTIGIPFITISNINKSGRVDFSNTYYVPQSYYEEIKHQRKPKQGDILYTVTGSFGIPVFIDFEKEFCFQRHIGLIRPSSLILSKYLYYFLQTPDAFGQAEREATGMAQKTVSLKSLRNFQIPLPPLDIQESIVARIQEEQALVNANKKLIELFEQKIKDEIGKLWGGDTSELVVKNKLGEIYEI